MESPADQPWAVFARRPTPLAGLLQSQGNRGRVDRAASQAEGFAASDTDAFAVGDAEGFDEDLPPLEDFGESPEPADAA
jgi:hypothetical protein